MSLLLSLGLFVIQRISDKVTFILSQFTQTSDYTAGDYSVLAKYALGILPMLIALINWIVFGITATESAHYLKQTPFYTTMFGGAITFLWTVEPTILTYYQLFESLPWL